MKLATDTFQIRLKELRIARGATHRDMGELLGITPRAYQYYESGSRYPDFKGLIALADYFDVSIDYLVGRTDNRTG